jgi:hypothetical protein
MLLDNGIILAKYYFASDVSWILNANTDVKKTKNPKNQIKTKQYKTKNESKIMRQHVKCKKPKQQPQTRKRTQK